MHCTSAGYPLDPRALTSLSALGLNAFSSADTPVGVQGRTTTNCDVEAYPAHAVATVFAQSARDVPGNSDSHVRRSPSLGGRFSGTQDR